jgi:hypothetical protein
MNEQTETLIRELAVKLGTTAEHLWGVLIRQAPIHAASTMLGFAVAIGLLAFVGVRIRRAVLSDDCCNEAAIFGGLVWAAFTAGVLGFLCMSINDMASGLFNPEYWALKEVLRNLK